MNPVSATKAKSQAATTNTTMTTNHPEATASHQGSEQSSLQQVKDNIVDALKKNDDRLTKNELVNKFISDLGEELYYQAEDALIEEELIERCLGRNGGIRRLVQQDDSQSQIDPESSDSIAEESLQREKDHYEPALKQIEKHWTDERSEKHIYGAVTAYQGKRSTGGRWSRPDITLCTVSKWIFSSRPEGEIITIEIKLFDKKKFDINEVYTGVYEALAHKSRSHYSYLMIANFPKQEELEKLTPKKKKIFEQGFDRVMSAAARHGIGIITAPNSNDWITWEFPLEPIRSNAGHREINQFLLSLIEFVKINKFFKEKLQEETP